MHVEHRGVAAPARQWTSQPGDLGRAARRSPRGALHTIRAADGRPPQAAHDPRPPPQRVRPAGAAPSPRARRRADPDGPLPEHERPQPRRRLRPPARALPHWDAVREAPVDEVEDAIRPGGLAPTKAVRIKQILDALGDDDLRWLEDAPLEEARDYLCALPGRGPQDRGLRAAVLVRAPGRPGGHPRLPRGLAARALAEPGARSTRRTTRCCGWSATTRGRLRGPRAADPPRPPHLRGARAALRGVPAAADVPRGPAAAGAARVTAEPPAGQPALLRASRS